MSTLEEALERIRPAIADAFYTGKNHVYSGSKDYNYFFSGPTTATVARLRLDWELAKDVVESATNDKLAEMMVAQMYPDLSDLIEHGDVTNYRDPLLNAMDGSKKRGKAPRNIDIFEVNLYSEYKEKKNSYEYTVFILLAVQWEE